MTIVLLALVTLFALVVTSRPILADADLSSLYVPTPSTPQTALQAAFQVPPGKDDPKFDASQFQGSKQQIEDLSVPNAEDVGATPSFEMSTSALKTPVDNTDVLDISDDHGATPSVDEQLVTPLHVVLAFSCVAAFLALACTVLMLYTIRSLRSHMLASKTAWELLPRFWGRSASEQETRTAAWKYFLYGGRHLPRLDHLGAEEGSAEAHGVHTEDKPLYFDAISDMESESDNVDEKYQDALDMTPLPRINDLLVEENPSHMGDPPLPPTGFCLLNQPTGDCDASLMRERCSSPVSRPAWSVRAFDAPALGLSVREGSGVTSAPKPLLHPRRRAYRSAVPELDIALAMQLRPGLGLGADSAWMVRFLMTMFGWFAVALTARTR